MLIICAGPGCERVCAAFEAGEEGVDHPKVLERKTIAGGTIWPWSCSRSVLASRGALLLRRVCVTYRIAGRV